MRRFSLKSGKTMLTLPQILSFAVIVLMMAAFIWGRLRYDLVAALSLLAAVAVGVVPFGEAFSGFSDDIVIIVGSALLVSAGVARSGIMEYALQRYAPGVGSVRAQLALLVITVAVLSAFVKNIGALAIMIPIAFQFARRSGVSPSVFLMPMAFASLLGGLMTQIGTSPNVVVSRLREDLTGTAFSMFDFTPVGLALTAAGCLFLTSWCPRASATTMASMPRLPWKTTPPRRASPRNPPSPASRFPLCSGSPPARPPSPPSCGKEACASPRCRMPYCARTTWS
jgi:hypothetical protein